jgi:predicted nucleic acid-binding protein
VTGWLLDTNILSAFAPGKPAIGPTIAGWFNERSDELYLSAITAAEIEAGISKAHRTGSERKANELRDWFERMTRPNAAPPNSPKPRGRSATIVFQASPV